MVELTNEVIERILHKETAKKEETATILRAVYTRYMLLYEKYFADIDALNDETVAGLRGYNEETASLVKYYYLDIPADVCEGIKAFEEKYSAGLLGPEWKKTLAESYERFREKNTGLKEKPLKEAFAKQSLSDFYDAMDYLFRDAFGTASKIGENVLSGLTGLLFGNSKSE